MKLLHVMIAAGVASVLPSAWADERAEPKPFTIAFSSDIKPIAHADFRYPSMAGARELSGSCDASFTVSVSGEPDAIRIGECSSDIFRKAAKSTVEGMTFAPRAVAADNVKMQIRWSMGAEVPMRTASLN